MNSERISTGIPALDHLLQGGFSRSRTYVVTGDAGTGKTIACLQFLLHSLKTGEKAVYVTVDERPAEILESAASFSWDIQPYIQEKTLIILDAAPYFGARSGNSMEKGVDPQKIVADLGSYVKRLNATLLIIDPITPLILPHEAANGSQDQARSLIQLLQSQIATTNLFTAHRGRDTANGIEQFLASGVLLLKNTQLNDGSFQRTLTIKKMRGTRVEPAEYVFALTPNEGFTLPNCSSGGTSGDTEQPATFEYFHLTGNRSSDQT